MACTRLILGACVTLGGTVVAGERVDGQPAPYRVLVAAESEDEVALVEFRPCAATESAPACGAKVARTYSVGVNPVEIEGPHGVVASRDGRSFYVSMAHGRPYGRLLRYDLASGAMTAQAELGMFPATIDLSAAGDLAYVINFNFDDPAMQPSSLSVVDTETLEEVARTTTCRMPHGSRVAPNGKHHYSVCMMDDLLVEVDARTAKVSRQLRLTAGTASCSPTWVQPTVDGKAIWVACNASSEAVIIDPTTWSVRQRVRTPAAPYNMAATPDGSLMILTQKAPGTTTLWRTTDATLVAEIPGTRRIASGVVVSADSRFAFVTLEGRNADPGTVDIIDLATRATVASVNVGKQAGGIAIVP